MRKNTKIHIEVLWLAICIVVSGIIFLLFFYRNLDGKLVDVNFYDTKYVFPAWTIWFPLLVFVIFVFYTIRESRIGFSRNLPNWILFVAGVTMVVTLTLMVSIVQGLLAENRLSGPGEYGFVDGPLSTLWEITFTSS